MKKNKKENKKIDERIERQMLVSYKWAYMTMSIILGISLITKALIYQMQFITYAVEFIAIMVGGFIPMIASIRGGYLDMGVGTVDVKTQKKRTIWICLGATLLFSAFVAVRNYLVYDFDPTMIPILMLVMFIIFAVLFTAFLGCYVLMVKHFIKQKEKKLDTLEEEMDEI